MDDVTRRFLDLCNFLISQKIVNSASDFAKKVGISTSMMTELSKGRTNVGVKPLQNTVSLFSSSAEWLLNGKGDMLKSGDTHNNVSEAASHHSDASEIIEYQQKLIDRKDDEIKSLNREIGALKRQLEFREEPPVLYCTEFPSSMMAAEPVVEAKKPVK